MQNKLKANGLQTYNNLKGFGYVHHLVERAVTVFKGFINSQPSATITYPNATNNGGPAIEDNNWGTGSTHDINLVNATFLNATIGNYSLVNAPAGSTIREVTAINPTKVRVAIEHTNVLVTSLQASSISITIAAAALSSGANLTAVNGVYVAG